MAGTFFRETSSPIWVRIPGRICWHRKQNGHNISEDFSIDPWKNPFCSFGSPPPALIYYLSAKQLYCQGTDIRLIADRMVERSWGSRGRYHLFCWAYLFLRNVQKGLPGWIRSQEKPLEASTTEMRLKYLRHVSQILRLRGSRWPQRIFSNKENWGWEGLEGPDEPSNMRSEIILMSVPCTNTK